MSNQVANKLLGVVGGSLIGSDPFSVKCWSGSSRFFFNELNKRKHLHNAIGVEIHPIKKYLYILRNYHYNIENWRQRFHLDTGYYNSLTKLIQKKLENIASVDTLQIGGVYDVPAIMNGKGRCFSYHDGNFAQLHRSPFFPLHIPQDIIEKAYTYERNVYQKIDAIFTMSEYLRQSFINDFQISPAKVFCIGAGINMETIPHKIKKAFDNKSILFVGVDFFRKGGDLLIEAFKNVVKKMPEASLHIVGPSKLPTKYSDIKNIHFHGFLSKDDSDQFNTLKNLYHNASLFVLPSRYEPFGIAPLEAMVFQTPCLLSDGWAFPEMVANGACGELTPTENVDELARKILDLLGDTGKLSQMGENARNQVLEKYTWEKVVDNMEVAINNLPKRDQHFQ